MDDRAKKPGHSGIVTSIRGSVVDMRLRMSDVFGDTIFGMTGQRPSRFGCQPTIGTELDALEERIANTGKYKNW